jgi:hypothetical protein
MPTILNRQPKIDPAALYKCLDSHLGNAGMYKEGNTYRGDDPGVKLHPHLFIADAGLTDEEFAVARQGMRLASHVPTPVDIPISSHGIPIGRVRPLRVDEAVVAVEAIPPTLVGAADYRAPIAPGTVLAKTDPLVKAYPKLFRPATPADMPAA